MSEHDELMAMLGSIAESLVEIRGSVFLARVEPLKDVMDKAASDCEAVPIHGLAPRLVDCFGILGDKTETEPKPAPEPAPKRLTNKERIKDPDDGIHGTTSGYYAGCRCDRCKKAQREYNHAYHERMKPRFKARPKMQEADADECPHLDDGLCKRADKCSLKLTWRDCLWRKRIDGEELR